MRVRPQSKADEQIADFIATYLALCRDTGDSPLPRRNMTISAVARFAAEMTIVDLRSDDEWLASLNGTGHSSHARIDRTGQNVLATCSPKERALRLANAKQMFAMPCGLRATLVETFENGAQATLASASLPLIGNQGQRMIVTYGLLIEDIEETYADRPVLRSIEITDQDFIDLGHGVPALPDR